MSTAPTVQEQADRGDPRGPRPRIPSALPLCALEDPPAP